MRLPRLRKLPKWSISINLLQIVKMKTSWLKSISLAALTVVKADVNAGDAKPAAKRPNIIFILTDDQDARMNSVEYMQGVQHHLVSLVPDL